MYRIRQSLVAKCSSWILLAILFSSLGVGLVTFFWISSDEIHVQRNSLEDLLATMQNSIRIACFANNPVLAQEVVDGLLRNKLVNGAVIWSDKQVLAKSGQEILRSTSRQLTSIVQPVYSPFDNNEEIGQIAVSLDLQVIQQEVLDKIRFVGELLGLQAVLLALIVNLVVLRMIVRPLKRIGSGLHSLRPFEGDVVAKSKSHEFDELGVLVDDINRLNHRLTDAYAEEKELHIRREQDEKRFRSIFEHAQTGLFVTDNSGQLVSSNPRFLKYLGIRDGQSNLFGTPLGKDPARLKALLAGVDASIDYFELNDETGEANWLELNLHRINDETLQGILNDVTELKRQELHQSTIAHTDALTGIANRRSFDKHLAKLLKGQRHNDLPFALMLIDLDWFKAVNDDYGHTAGDRVLSEVADILRASVRESDHVSRLGGDEFAVLITDANKPESLLQVAENIIAGICHPIRLGNGKQVQIGASIGIAVGDAGCESAQVLFNQADQALYQAKQSGRNRCRIYSVSPAVVPSI